MSFNSRLGSSRVHRGRPCTKFSRGPQGPSVPQEDAQPNELLGRRNVSGPPAVRSSAPQSHRSSTGHHPPRGRGNIAPSPRRWSARGMKFNDASGSSRGIANAHGPSNDSTWTQPWGVSHEKPSEDSRGSKFAVGSISAAAVSRTADVPPNNLFLPFPPADPVKETPFNHTERLGPSTATLAIPSSTQSIATSGASSGSWPPPKRRKVVRSGSDLQSRSHRLRESPPLQQPSNSTQVPTNESTTPTHGQKSYDAPPATAPSPSNSLVSASDLLLADLSLPSCQNSITTLIPIPNRLKIVSPSPATPTHPLPPPPDNAPPSSTVQEVHPAASLTSNSTAPTAPAAMPVKRERSPSPSLALAAPRLVTEGCVRIAPLPPECRNRQPNFQAARLQLAAAEMKKLRALGLQIVRIFTREDGMVVDWKSPHPVLSDTLRPPPPPPASEPVVFHTAADAAPARGAGTAQPTPTKPVQPTVTESVRLANAHAEHPANRPKKRRKQKASCSGAPEGVVPKPPPELSVQLTADPSLIAGPSPSAVSSIASQPTLPASDQRRDPTLPQRVPPAAKKPTDRSRGSAPRLPSDIFDLTEDGPPSIPAPPSHAAGPIPRTPPPDTSSRSRATHQPPPASGPPSCPSSTNGGPATSTTGSATLPPPVHAPAPPARIADGELEDAALDFIERYIHVFTTARAALAAAYSPSAFYSFQYQSPLGPAAHKYLAAPRQGRRDILAALLALPSTLTLCSFPPRPSAHELVWDVGRVPGSASGDVLLVCYAVQDFDWNVVARANGNGKEKEKEEEKERWSFVQHFILRRRDGDGDGDEDEDEDEDDRAVAALWPLVAVSHQITFRRLL